MKLTLLFTLFFTSVTFGGDNAYLLSFMFNIQNFEPVVGKDCVKFSEVSSAIGEATKTVSKMEDAGFKCEKSTDTVSWSCQNTSSGVVAKVVIMYDKKECRKYPSKMIKDIRKLINK